MKSFAEYVGATAAGLEQSKGPLGVAAQTEMLRDGPVPDKWVSVLRRNATQAERSPTR